MAKKAKHASPADTEPPLSAEEVFKEHYEICLALKLIAEKDAKTASASNSAFRNGIKAAKKGGVDGDALVEVLALRKQEPDDVTRRFKNLNNYMLWIGLPVGAQLGLDLATGKTIATLVDDKKIGEAEGFTEGRPITTEAAIGKARTAGFDAGHGGKARDTNPHDDGSPEFLAYDAAWVDGQAKLAGAMTGKRGRGAGEQRLDA